MCEGSGPLTQPPVLPKIRPPAGQCDLEIAPPRPRYGTQEEALHSELLLGVSHTHHNLSLALMIEDQGPGPS